MASRGAERGWDDYPGEASAGCTAGRRMRAAGGSAGGGPLGAGVTGGAGCSAVSSVAFGTLTSGGAAAVGAGGGGRGARSVGIPLAVSGSAVAAPSCHQSNSPSVRRSARAGKSGCRSWTERLRAAVLLPGPGQRPAVALLELGQRGGGREPSGRLAAPVTTRDARLPSRMRLRKRWRNRPRST